MRHFGILLVLLAVGAGPATQPTNTSQQLQQQVKEAETQADKAHAACMAKLEATDDYKALAADVLAKETLLKAARATGTTPEKMDASSAYNKAREAVAVSRKKATAADGDVQATSQRASLLRKQLVATMTKEEADAEAARMRDPVYRAFREGRVVAGMPEQQMLQVFNRQKIEMNRRDREDMIGGKRLVTHIYTPGTYYQGFSRIVVENGIVVSTDEGELRAVEIR